MPRKKISEHAAKTILYGKLQKAYTGIEVDTLQDWDALIDRLDERKLYVVKVDQGIKGRFKKGLVSLGRTKGQLGGGI